jgi:hypothetical protein
MTRTKLPPSVGKDAAVPLTARASIDARMNPKTDRMPFSGKKPALSASHDDQRRHEDDDAPQTDLYERETGGVTAQAEEHTEIRADYRHDVLPCTISVAFAATRRLTRRRRCVARGAII